MRLLLVLCAISLALPANAEKPRRRDDRGPIVLLTTAPLLQIEDEREDLRDHLARADRITSDALRRARRAAAEDELAAAQDRLDEVRELLGLSRRPRASTVLTREGADPRLANGVVSQEVVVADLNAVLHTLGLVDRHLSGAAARENRGGGLAALLSDARAEVQAARDILTRIVAPPQPPMPPTPPPSQPQVWPISDQALQSLLAAMDRENWARDRLGVLESAASSHFFLVAQVLPILGRFEFSNQKLKAVAVLKARILDTQNFYQLYGAFQFSSDKEELRKLLEGNGQATLPIPPPQPGPPAPAVQPMDPASLQALLGQMRAAYTNDGRYQMLQQAASTQYFVIQQVQAIAGVFNTPDARMRSVVVLRDRILDRQNFEALYNLFPNAQDRARLRDLLGR